MRSPRELAALALQLGRRELAQRYRGTLFGPVWLVAQPVAMLAVYGFVFGWVLQARWPALAGTHPATGYALMLLAGLVLHGFLAECIVRAPTQVVAQANFVKKIVFPLPVLALAGCGAAVAQLAVNLALLTVFQGIIAGIPPLTILLAPVAVFPLVLFGLGLMWMFSAIGVYFRDIGQLAGMAVLLALFVSPALYPLDLVPAGVRWLFFLNPLSAAIEFWRALAILGEIPALSAMALFWIAGSAFAIVGWRLFVRMSRGFADVL